MSKLELAARQALDALELVDDGNTWAVHEAITALREALAEPELNLNCKSVKKRLATSWGYVKAEQQEQVAEWGKLKDPQTLFVNLNRGFPAQLTHDHLLHLLNKTEQAEQEPVAMDDHPPHRLCECRKCMEYFTPLHDCDAFAASGKPIAKQTNTQFMEGYRIGLAEMREKCAKVVTEHVPTCSPNWVSYVVAIRAIKFEGDTGFRPVSEMIAEHKQDPKKAAAIEKAKMRKAEQEPVAVVEITYGREPECYVTGNVEDLPEGVFKLYTAPQPVSQEPVKREHITDGSPCWCNPELNYKDPETGAEVWIHKEPQ